MVVTRPSHSLSSEQEGLGCYGRVVSDPEITLMVGDRQRTVDSRKPSVRHAQEIRCHRALVQRPIARHHRQPRRRHVIMLLVLHRVVADHRALRIRSQHNEPALHSRFLRSGADCSRQSRLSVFRFVPSLAYSPGTQRSGKSCVRTVRSVSWRCYVSN